MSHVNDIFSASEFQLKPLAKQTRKSTQVGASLQNQNLRTDLRWVAKRIHKSALKFKQIAKSVNFTHTQMTCDQLVSTCALACEFGFDQNERKSAQEGGQTKRKFNTS